MRSGMLAIMVLLVLAFMSGSGMAQSRDQIRIVGSSTVFPFSTAVAEEFGKNPRFKSPIVEPTGTGGGIELFCNGVGIDFPDVANASRRIKPSEVARCARRGVKEIIEVKIGYDGIVLANLKESPDYKLSLRDLYLALAAQIPADGSAGGVDAMVKNPHERWSDIDPRLPDVEIAVLGPPPTSGTRDAFNELAMEGGCDTFAGMAAIKKRDSGLHRKLCQTIREDGHYIEAGENDNLIVRKLEADPDALGIFGFSFLDQNTDRIKGTPIARTGTDYAKPTFDNIAQDIYPISRSMFFYVKKAHIGVIPGLKEYMTEFVRERASGDFGYLTDKGLIPLLGKERERAIDVVQNLRLLDLEGA